MDFIRKNLIIKIGINERIPVSYWITATCFDQVTSVSKNRDAPKFTPIFNRVTYASCGFLVGDEEGREDDEEQIPELK